MTPDLDETLSILGSCDNDHCSALGQFLVDTDVPVEALGYEDVFYPLRHHHQDGLGLRFTWNDMTETLVWGAGDFIYRADDQVRTMETAVDPFDVYTLLQTGTASAVTVTIVDEATAEGDHG